MQQHQGRSSSGDKPGAFGSGLAESFRLGTLEAHASRSPRRGIVAVTHLKSELPTREPTHPVADDAFLIGLQLWDSPDHEFWLDGRPFKYEPFNMGETAFYDLRRSTSTFVRTPFNSLQFYLPRKALYEAAEQIGGRFNGELKFARGAPHRDPVIGYLGAAILPALADGKAVDALFLDHALDAFVAHITTQYGGVDRQRLVVKGGLSAWQERRAKEMIAGSLGADISLRALADACQLSTTHFARAFRKSTGNSPHQWLQARRVEKAMQLLFASRRSLAEIALACGFAHQSHFTRVFAQRTGTSPGVWRRQHAPRW